LFVFRQQDEVTANEEEEEEQEEQGVVDSVFRSLGLVSEG